MEKHTELKVTALSILEKHKIRTRGEYRFTGSALPVCPLRVALSRSPEFSRVSNCRSDGFTETGSSLHTAVQRWLGEAGIAFGKFTNGTRTVPEGPQFVFQSKAEETRLKKEHKVLAKYDVDNYNLVGGFGPYVDKDGSLYKYCEWRVYDPDTGFSGLVDDVVKLEGWRLPSTVDFKFLGASSFSKFLKEGLGPEDPYRCQLNAYRYLLEKYPLRYEDGSIVKLSTTSYLMVFRDDFYKSMSPASLNVIPVEYDPDSYERQAESYKFSRIQCKKRNLRFFLSPKARRCNTALDCHFCPGESICFGMMPERNITRILKGLWNED